MKLVWIAVGASSLLHVVLLAWLSASERSKPDESQKVKIRVVEVPKPDEPPPPIPPKPKEKPKERKPPVERKSPEPPPEKPVEVVQGVTKESVATEGTGPAVPVGNTLMVGDEGKRLNPDDVQSLGSDLSSDAKLVRSSLQIPEYTPEAIDAGIEGVFIVDVYVDEKGNVVQVELQKRIGFGMDERVLASARAAKYTPKRTKQGATEASWAELPFKLILP